MQVASTAELGIIRREKLTLSLVSIGHGFSHFYMLVVPPLFPFLKAEFGVSYTALGALLAVYGAATGIGQLPAGLLVDRFGARPMLLLGLGLNAAAIALAGFADSYWPFLVMMAVAGLGNAVFHPADYSILAARIGKKRLGRAFSIHLFVGFIGFALAPPLALLLTNQWSWHEALTILGLAGVVFTVVLSLFGDAVSDSNAGDGSAEKASERASSKSGLQLITSPAVMIFFMFYVLVAMASMGVQAFLVVSLTAMYDISVEFAGGILTAYFIGSATGTLIGGRFADRSTRPDRDTSIAFILSTTTATLIGFHFLPVMGVAVLIFMTGFFLSSVSPLRDLMVREIAPAGSVGTVFGIVSTGFSAGAALAPPLFGWVNDLGRPEYIFFAAGIITLLGILTVFGARASKA